MHHRAIVDAIANREPTRAEALAREHSRLARTSLEMVLRDKKLLTQVPGRVADQIPRGGLGAVRKAAAWQSGDRLSPAKAPRSSPTMLAAARSAAG